MGFFREIPPPFEHQARSTGFLVENDRVFDMSDPGTGKTRSALDAIRARQAAGAGKALVFAPKAILQPAWGNDIAKFAPNLGYTIARANNRANAFAEDVDVVITNHDAAKWIAEQLKKDKAFLDAFDILVIDEITAFKHRTSQRSKAMKALAKKFDVRIGLSGTPNPNSITDIWHQVLILDDGEHLGTSFWKFRSTVCEPVQVGPRPEMVQWIDKDGSHEAVADILEDITIRNVFEDCVDIPPNHKEIVTFELSPKHRRFYEDLKRDAMLTLEDGTISAVHAASLATKLLQTASGAVYDEDHVARTLSTERYELVMELAAQREQCVIAFNWTHQRDELVKLAEKMGFTFAVIDGSTKDADREAAVQGFQDGELKIIFAHPQSASHGLTLTKGTATIWASPIYDAERFDQFNRRIYRASQTKRTETLMVAAADTLDEQVYERLSGKLDRMHTLLDMLQTPTAQAA